MVVPAAVAVVAKPDIKRFADMFRLASQPAQEEAVAAIVTAVFAVPPFAMGKAVPDKVTANVPDVVMGEPAIDKNAGTDIATDVTVPEPPTVVQVGAAVPPPDVKILSLIHI